MDRSHDVSRLGGTGTALGAVPGPGRALILGALGAVVALGVGACGGDEMLGPDGLPPEISTDFDWRLPEGFPPPRVPEDNPMSAAKVALGRHLFYDVRLSGNQTQSCASCHEQERAFAHPSVVPRGSTGELHPRNAMALANVAYQPVLNWANPLIERLSQQALIPLFGEEPVELGLAGREDEMLDRLRADETYRDLFPRAFPDSQDPFTVAGVARALAAFQRTMISGNAPVDRARNGDRSALSASAQLGEALFFSERLECFHCHGGFLFTGTFDYEGKGFPQVEFHNTGLYNIDGQGGYPVPNVGLYEFTLRPEDMGRFKAPSLRNVALTAPYMHDGSVATLEEVIDHYAAGGRTLASGPHQGVGSTNPHKSGFVRGFTLTAQERQGLLDYLHALTDEEFVRDPRFSNPWPEGSPARPGPVQAAAGGARLEGLASARHGARPVSSGPTGAAHGGGGR